MVTISEVMVFSTNVMEPGQSELLIKQLQEHFPNSRISFDLEDCDKVLRVAGEDIDQKEVVRLLRIAGYWCEMML